MRSFRYGFLILIAALAAVPGAGQGLAITQIDTERLLFGQSVRLYLSAPGAAGTESPDVEVWESGEGGEWAPRPVTSVSRGINDAEGIAFFFLLDNSGSMWTGLDGREGAPTEDQRMTHAKAAARAFLAEASRQGRGKDRIGLGVFNTRYWKAADPVGDFERISRGLDEIRKPATEDAYTELYLSLDRALADFAGVPGRRALVVLSDGENFPYYVRTGKPNPETGTRTTGPEDVVERAAREGITVYVVRFGNEKDPSLGDAAVRTGGKVFDASNRDELAAVYSTIRADVLAEIAVDYRAGMAPGSRRNVRAVLRDREGRAYSSERYYYAGTVLGWSRDLPGWYYLAFLLVPALLWLALLVFKLERETTEAGLRLLYGPSGGGTRVFTLNSPQTVIGSSDAADFTIGGNPSLKERHATILFDERQNAYTVVGDGNLTVNNREVERKRLEPGDVINMAGTVVVFDDALVKKTPKGRLPQPSRRKSQ